MEKLTDHRLLLLIQKGNHAAFTAFVNRYWEEIYTYTKSRIRQGVDAQDIVQDIFISCWNNRERLHIGENGRLTAYLYQAARYAIIDYFSRPGITVYNDILLEAVADRQMENNSEAQLYLKELELHIRQEVDQLPDRLKMPYLLSREGNLSLKDIALKMSLSEQTVKNNITTALRILRARLHENEHYLGTLMLVLALPSYNNLIIP
ncbi:sigma-70 family RNA polymerase sigma factor [Chitinophaga flava]|uniref:RNA polymerase n=1 Tax=Chitinophaga flava TaxID=2259036 RepID=A0A365XPX5_9BACT|nr:sigma-70 family RNA polymerase sigma factor [Chitinophaga flava]RBL88200.1 RNA polymerase [Chitinophaga flava]